MSVSSRRAPLSGVCMLFSAFGRPVQEISLQVYVDDNFANQHLYVWSHDDMAVHCHSDMSTHFRV